MPQVQMLPKTSILVEFRRLRGGCELPRAVGEYNVAGTLDNGCLVPARFLLVSFAGARQSAFMRSVTVGKKAESMIADIPAEENGVVEIDYDALQKLSAEYEREISIPSELVRIGQSVQGFVAASTVAESTAEELAKILITENEELAVIIKDATEKLSKKQK